MTPSGQNVRPVLFIGSCMVNGYPFPYEDSFVHHACEMLRARGLVVEALREAPAKTTQFERIADAIRRHNPEVVVLQLGGLETILLIADVVRRKLGLTVPKRDYNNHLHTSPFRKWHLKARWRLMTALKRAADALLGHPIVDFAEYRANLRKLLELARDHTNGPVLILGLFPAIEPVSRYYRTRLEPVFIEECARARVRFLNLAEAWRIGGRDGTIFHDPIHLNVRGHRWLAPLVAGAIEECLASRTTPPQNEHDAREAQTATQL